MRHNEERLDALRAGTVRGACGFHPPGYPSSWRIGRCKFHRTLCKLHMLNMARSVWSFFIGGKCGANTNEVEIGFALAMSSCVLGSKRKKVGAKSFIVGRLQLIAMQNRRAMRAIHGDHYCWEVEVMKKLQDFGCPVAFDIAHHQRWRERLAAYHLAVSLRKSTSADVEIEQLRRMEAAAAQRLEEEAAQQAALFPAETADAEAALVAAAAAPAPAAPAPALPPLHLPCHSRQYKARVKLQRRVRAAGQVAWGAMVGNKAINVPYGAPVAPTYGTGAKFGRALAERAADADNRTSGAKTKGSPMPATPTKPKSKRARQRQGAD